MTVRTMTAAIVEAVDQEMARDQKVFVAGEDVRVGGPFGTNAGLFEKYGPKRVVNTAISELALTGLGVGAAAVGLRPVVEIMIMDFVAVAMDQIVNQMAKMKYMLGGQAVLPRAHEDGVAPEPGGQQMLDTSTQASPPAGLSDLTGLAPAVSESPAGTLMYDMGDQSWASSTISNRRNAIR